MIDQTEVSVPAKTIKPIKAAIVGKLLSRPRGASLGDITAATGWQTHSIRAFLTGLRKKGLTLSGINVGTARLGFASSSLARSMRQ